MTGRHPWPWCATAIVLCTIGFATLGTAGAHGPAGIKIKQNRNGTIGPLIAEVHSGSCRLVDGSFHFRGGGRKLSLHVEIDDWKGYGHRYELTVDSPGKVFVDRANQSNGAYSSEFAIPGSTTGTMATVRFAGRGSVIRIGAPDLPNFDYSRFLLLSGAARCRHR